MQDKEYKEENAKLDKILFISSNYTGNGHKSIIQSLYNQFEKLNQGISIEEVDAFLLGGVFTKTLSKLYNKVAVFAPRLWGALYKLGNKIPSLINSFIESTIKKNFLKLIQESKPNLIVTVHPAFIGSIINILEKNGLNIPVIVIVADLDNISHLWADKRSLYTLCPSKESYNSLVELGIPKDRLRIFGFPTRDIFNHVSAENVHIPIACTVDNSRLNFFIMNGSQGGSFSKQISESLLENFNCNVVILVGKNTRLKKSLESYLKPKYPDRITVYGFTDKVNYYMMNSDILLIRASPNVLMEAINLCKPVIITGSFTGQEEKNPQFVTRNNLGVECEDINKLPQVVRELIDNNGKMLKEIRESQLKFRQPNAASDIVKFIVSVLQNIKNKRD